MKTLKTHIVKPLTTILLVSVLAIAVTGCQKDGLNKNTGELNELTGYYLPKSLIIGLKARIPGTGLGEQDFDAQNLYLRPIDATDASRDVSLPYDRMTGWNIDVTVPDATPEGSYYLLLKRANGEQIIRRSAFPQVFNWDDFVREDIEGDAIIVSDAVIQMPAAASFFAEGQEVTIKGSFNMSDSVYFASSAGAARLGVVPSYLNDNQMRVIVPTGALTGQVRLARQTFFTNIGSVPIAVLPTVSRVVMPTTAIAAGASVAITATSGFANGDKILLVQGNNSRVVDCTVTDDTKIEFTMPSDYTAQQSTQALLVRTGSPELSLGFLYPTAPASTRRCFVDDLSFPAYLPTGVNATARTCPITIKGKGFLPGDVVFINGAAFGAGNTTVTPTSITTVISTAIGITPVSNVVIAVRRESVNDQIGTVSFVTAPRPFDAAQGGVVFWLDPDNPLHGMACAVKDRWAGATAAAANDRWPWGKNKDANGAMITPSSCETAIGTGKTNTQDMIRVYGTDTEVANYCDQYTVTTADGTFDDWFLPSFDELMVMYTSRTNINNAATAAGGAVFDATAANANLSSGTGSDGHACSSSYDIGRVRCVNFNNNGGSRLSNRENQFRIRPVREYIIAPPALP